MGKRVLWVVILISSAATLFAQPVIIADDFRKLIGKTSISAGYTTFDVSGLSELISATGANQTWDITDKMYFKIDSSSMIYLNYPADAPMATDPAYKGANLVSRTRELMVENNIIQWGYTSLVDSGFLAHGSVVDSAGAPPIPHRNTPPILSYKFPVTYNSTWTTSSTISAAGGVVITKATYTHLVDGYGTLKTPAGNFPCLRIQQKIVAEGQVPPSGKVTSYNYFFLGKDTPWGLASIMADEYNLPFILTYVNVDLKSAVEQTRTVAFTQFELMQNFPNPFNPSTTIEYHLPKATDVSLKIYNLLGEEIAILQMGHFSAGKHSVQWNASGIASGVYLYRLQTSDFTATGKLVRVD